MTGTTGRTANSASQANCGPRIDLFCNLGQCFRDDRNDYSMYEPIKDRYGVYIFLDLSNHPLYIGEAHDQDLYDRIKQNFTKSSGGTFRDNWARKNGGQDVSIDSKEDKEDKRKKNLCLFKRKLRDKNNAWKIITISFARVECEQKRRNHWIHVLEKALIGFFDPEYNKS